MVFLLESWFWRGTQSAVFYYVSTYASCLDCRDNRKRRKQAAKAREEKENSLIHTQPGIVRQPDPFETNEEWAQEIVQGPGPPKGWKRDSLYYKYARKFQRVGEKESHARPRGITINSTESPAKSVFTGITEASTAVDSAQGHQAEQIRADISAKDLIPLQDRKAEYAEDTGNLPKVTNSDPRDGSPPTRGDDHKLQTTPSAETGTTGSKRSSFESESTVERRPPAPRPSMEGHRKLSTGFKETMRATLHPEHWNWIRYDRDDEILSNINDRMRGMWDNVKGHMTTVPLEETPSRLTTAPAEVASMEDRVKKWQRGTHPAVNDLSPPIVSQLPSTREEAQWMLLPPASADVMMGRSRPDLFDDIDRKPLCIIGRPNQEVQVTSERHSSAGSLEDDEAGSLSSGSAEEWTKHLQKPQRAYLYKRRASYV